MILIVIYKKLATKKGSISCAKEEKSLPLNGIENRGEIWKDIRRSARGFISQMNNKQLRCYMGDFSDKACGDWSQGVVNKVLQQRREIFGIKQTLKNKQSKLFGNFHSTKNQLSLT